MTNQFDACILLIYDRSRSIMLAAQSRENQETVEDMSRRLADQQGAELADLKASE
jgi:hypothetical protein